MHEAINNKRGIASALNSIGVIYGDKLNFSKALEFYERSLKIREEIGDKDGIANSLVNLGYNYKNMGNYNKALENYNASLHLCKEIFYSKGMAIAYGDISEVYFNIAGKENEVNKKNKINTTAFLFADSSNAISKKLGYPSLICDAEKLLSLIESSRGNYAEALNHYKQFVYYQDSLNNENTRKASIKSQLNYEFEKKEAVIKEQQEKERAVAEEKNRFQKIVIASVLLGLVLVMIFAVFVFRSLKVTRQQKHIIEEKQKEILDSIRYAKRIQTSLLPTEKYIAKQLDK